ncbi:MAG: glycoside hydrolase family 97 protein [bacterium]
MSATMKRCLKIFSIHIILSSILFTQSWKYHVESPDKKTTMVIEVKDQILISINHLGQPIVYPSPISMELEGNVILGKNPTVVNVEADQIASEIEPAVAEKRKVIHDIYNTMKLDFAGKYGLTIRAYDDGVAYRFFTKLPGDIVVRYEELVVNLAEEDSLWFPQEQSFMSHSERLYPFYAVKSIQDTQMCCLPALVAKANGWKVAITESDLLDYAGLYLQGVGGGKASLKSKFPPYPLEEKMNRDRNLRVTKAADYIAKTNGTREFPWRVFGIAEKDGGLIENDIVYRLGTPSKILDRSWIKPGRVAWDWWNANNVYGVNFKSGVNTDTYKYYIDFASKYGIEYIILDEGWSMPADVFKIDPKMNLEELFAYAKQKNVGIILWVLWNAIESETEKKLDTFVEWGAKGIKVDFMQRDDQKMVNYYERIAKEAAKRHLLVDFHGSYKPTGLSRTYPNVLTREGVCGLEHNKWSEDITPKHDVTLPFTRMFAGAMDFTPGAMVNAAKGNFKIIFNQPMSQGTRCHQLAMYVVYESPLQMLSDVPSNYLKEPEVMEFLAKVPTTWDETKALNARVGEYVTVARKKGNDWYIGSMTDWTPRDFELNLSFLDTGMYEALIYADGMNADRYGSDYAKEKKSVTKSDLLKIHLAPGGGWVGVIRKR